MPGAHRTAKELTWDTVGSKSSSSGYALAASGFASPLSLSVAHAVYWDANGCLRRRYMNDSDGIWYSDTTLRTCGDFGWISDPAAVSWAVGRLDVFWFEYSLVMTPALLKHAFWDGSTWRYESLGYTATRPSGPPAVGSWGVGHLDVMWVDTNGNLRRRAFDRGRKGAPGYDANGWAISDTTIWSSLTASQISVTEPTTNEIHIAYRNSAGRLSHIWTHNDYFFYGEGTAISIDTAPSAVSWGAGHLNVFAARNDTLRQLSHDSSGWHDTELSSAQKIGVPVAAAALGRPNRIDVLGSPDGIAVSHTFYQESLPGFAELYNPQTSYWCWANAAGAVVNYFYQSWGPWDTCTFVGTHLGYGGLCCSSNPPSDCFTTGDPSDVLDEWGLTWTKSSVLSPSQLRFEIQTMHRPVISHQDSNVSSINHVVVIRDIYSVAGVDYVVIADPANYGKTWVWPYSTYVTYNGNWHVDYMYTGIRWQ